MRTLTSTLQAAAQSASAEPAVTVSISPRIDSIRRLRWESVYSGSEPDKPHGLAVAGDGAALRARTVAGSPNDALSYQRVANPGPGSAWGSWASLESVGAGTGVPWQRSAARRSSPSSTRACARCGCAKATTTARPGAPASSPPPPAPTRSGSLSPSSPPVS